MAGRDDLGGRGGQTGVPNAVRLQQPRAGASVRAFTITPPEAPSGLYMPESARLRPAIAVLPFELRAANEDTATLGELLADEIITALSGTKTLDVISRLST